MGKIENDYGYLFKNNSDLAKELLIDKTTKKGIIWATDMYAKYGKGFAFSDSISTDIYVLNRNLFLKARSKKSKMDKMLRSKNNAEVFTPSWICNVQNNLVDNSWFGYSNVFNEEIEGGWITNSNKIAFPDNKNWIDYLSDARLEIACGEAPYIVSRYDSVSGEEIPLEKRIGIMDRKFRILRENCTNDEEWIDYSLIILKSIYGYEYQGDNLIIARENVFFGYLDYYYEKFGKLPKDEFMNKILEIISWNFWQMDGLKYVIPNSCTNRRLEKYTLFDGVQVEEYLCPGCQKDLIYKHNGIYSKVKDWDTHKSIKFINLLNRNNHF